MKLRLAASFLLPLIVLFTACAPPKTAASSADAAPHAGSIFFWRATKPGKPGTVFVLGAVHMRHEKAASLDRAITDAATRCERGAFEIDFDAVDNNELAAFIQREGMLQGKTLRDVVTPETYAALVKAADARHLPREQFEHLRPWMAAMFLGVASLTQGGSTGEGGGGGASGKEGVDRMLYTFEKQEPTRQRKVIGLETALDQIKLFQKTSEREQDRMLRSAALGVSSGDDGSEVLALYERGDEAGAAALLEEARKEDRKGDPESEELSQALIDRRNVSMTDKVTAMFDEPGCSVVAVGAAHVLGPGGIVRRLEEKGFSVQRVAPLGPTDSARMAFTVPASKEFVSKEDGFAVQTQSSPVRQESPVPGTKTPAHTYIFGDDLSGAITVSVHNVASDTARARLVPVLDKITAEALKKVGLTITKTETTSVQGEPGPRILGVASGPGPVRRGETVTVLHGKRLYMIMALQITETNPETLGENLTKFLATFRFAD